MTNYKVTVDNIEYDVCVIYGSLKRKFSILEGSNSGTAITGRSIRDIKGTVYSYEMEIEPNPDNRSDYDSFYEAISAPQDYHIVTFPYGQQTLTFEAMITDGSDGYFGVENSTNIWGNMQLTFNAMEPQRT